MAASNNCKPKANISADDDISEILRWVKNDNEEDEISLENDLFDLYGEVEEPSLELCQTKTIAKTKYLLPSLIGSQIWLVDKEVVT